MKKVLIVDDSVLARQMIKDAVASLPGFEAFIANTGLIALEKAAKLRPDLVILDLNLGPMDGLEVLSRLRTDQPEIIVIIFSAHTFAGENAFFKALSLGASDCVAKPTVMENGEGAAAYLRAELLPRIKSLVAIKKDRGTRKESSWAPAPPQRNKGLPRIVRTDFIAVASSTGGPRALEKILAEWEGSLPIPMVIVQHISATFIGLLAKTLASKSPFKVVVAADGEGCEAGCVYLAPGDYHLEMARDGERLTFRTNSESAENSCRPAANFLFRSVAEAFGSNSLGLVLTGMGLDGLKGCQALKEVGGHVLVQDEKSSVVWGMPGAVTQAGLADEVLPLDVIGNRLRELIKVGRPWF